jgi:hypothetical protein
VRFVRTRGQRSSLRWSEVESREADRRALLKSNPRIVLENVLSRYSVCMQVADRMVSHPGDTPAAIEFVAERVGVPVEIVRECVALENPEILQ